MIFDEDFFATWIIVDSKKRLDSLHSSVNFSHYRLFKHSTTQHNFLSFNNEFQCWKHYTSVIYTSFHTRETENEIYFSDFNDTFKQLILFVMSQSHRERILSSPNFVHISIIHIFTIVHSESLNVTTKLKFFLIAAYLVNLQNKTETLNLWMINYNWVFIVQLILIQSRL